MGDRSGRLRGPEVQISISYASDWAVQGLGVFIDDVTLPDGSTTSFEGGDTGGWAVAGPPPGSGPNANNFVFTTAAGFPEGAAITTEDTIYLGLRVRGHHRRCQPRGGHGPRDGLPAPTLDGSRAELQRGRGFGPALAFRKA